MELPPWHGWSNTSVAKRAVRWIEQYVRLPTGHGAGRALTVAPFQRQVLDSLYDNRATFVSLPASNGKTTFLAAVALERICRGDDYVEVDVLATKEEQAKILVETAKRMVESAPELVDLCSWFAHDAILEYRPTGSRIVAHPAKLAAIQGLNFSLAIIDEIGFVPDHVVETLLARLGKRPDATVIGIGTPGFEPNVMFKLRSEAGAGMLPDFVHYVEWSARAGCEIGDKVEWRKANPALRAGFLDEGALVVQAGLLDETSFRVYHLGQWVEGSTSWLPAGSWEANPYAPAPADGADVVLAVEGTYRQTTAVVVAGLDGTIAFGWAAEIASDDELRAVLDEAAARWHVLEIVVAPRIRPRLVADLEDEAVPVYRWTRLADDQASADELFRAIVERRVPHDHSEVIGAQMDRVVARRSGDGGIRLARPPDGAWCDAAMAVRMAWWRAGELAESTLAAGPSIY